MNLESNEVDYPNLSRYLKWNNIGTTILLGAFLIFWIYFITIPGYEYCIQNGFDAKKTGFISVAISMGIFIIGMQTSNFFLFRYFLRICKDNETLKVTPLPLDSISSEQRKAAIWEAVYISPFVLYFIGPNLIHLILTQKRFISPVLEIILYASVWLLVFRFNVEYPQKRKRRIAFAFVLLFIIFHVLRQIYD